MWSICTHDKITTVYRNRYRSVRYCRLDNKEIRFPRRYVRSKVRCGGNMEQSRNTLFSSIFPQKSGSKWILNSILIHYFLTVHGQTSHRAVRRGQ